MQLTLSVSCIFSLSGRKKDMLGFLRLRAWDAQREQTGKRHGAGPLLTAMPFTLPACLIQYYTLFQKESRFCIGGLHV